MYNGLLHLHSIIRYLALLLLLIAIFKAFAGWFRKQEFSNTDNKIGLLTLVVIHLQFMIGIVLYFISPVVQNGMKDFSYAMKTPELRFWAVEHISMMTIAVILITIGRVLSKKAKSDSGKYKKMAIFFTIGLILIIMAIPWPFSAIQRPWL